MEQAEDAKSGSEPDPVGSTYLDDNGNPCTIKKVQVCLIDEHFFHAVIRSDSESDGEEIELPFRDINRKDPQRWLGHHTGAVTRLMKANGGRQLTAEFLKTKKYTKDVRMSFRTRASVQQIISKSKISWQKKGSIN